MVGNEIVKAQPSVSVATPPGGRSRLEQVLDRLHDHSLIVFSLLFLAIAASGIEVGGRYWSAHMSLTKHISAPLKHDIVGLNLGVPASQLQSKLNSIASQPASLTVGSQTVPISSGTIKSWLRVTPSANKSQDSIYVDSTAMAKSLQALANKFARAPVNQVTVTHGSATQVIVAGRNGTQLVNPDSLADQAHKSALTLMNNNGLQFSVQTTTLPFQAVTPANFPKLIEADVTNKVVYAYQNGQLINTFLSSDGAPDTPTPLGEFHIYAKYAVQDMTGYNVNGTKYFQPRVPWVNYFTGGNAVHGVYWHPLSWFGVHNSSHGCVGLPVNEAEWVYDWAPIGTTVITHA